MVIVPCIYLYCLILQWNLLLNISYLVRSTSHKVVHRQQNKNNLCIWTLEETKYIWHTMIFWVCWQDTSVKRASFKSTTLANFFLASFGFKHLCLKTGILLMKPFLQSSLEKCLGIIHVLVSIFFPALTFAWVCEKFPTLFGCITGVLI